MKRICIALLISALLLLTACTGGETVENTLNGAPKEAESTSVKASFELEDAIDIALADAGFERSTAAFKEAKMDVDDGETHYDIEFVVSGGEYEYEISLDGKILKKVYEKNSVTETDTETKTVKSVGGYISVDDAVKAALDHAGLKKDDIVMLEAEFDGDDDDDDDDEREKPHYDIEFEKNGVEYEYEIDAETGKIISFEKD